MIAQSNDVAMETNYAGLGVRLRAFLWDYLLILLYITLLVTLSLLLRQVQNLFQNPVQSDAAAFIILVLPVMLYFALSEGNVPGATWGKRKMKLKVICADGNNLGIRRSLIRSTVKFLPWQVAHTAVFHSIQDGMFSQAVLWLLYAVAYGLVMLYLLMIWRNTEHRSLYDWVAGTAVVEV